MMDNLNTNPNPNPNLNPNPNPNPTSYGTDRNPSPAPAPCSSSEQTRSHESSGEGSVGGAVAFNYDVLCSAARRNDFEVVEQAVSQGANVNGVDHFGNNMIYLAAMCGHLPLVRYLLSAGAEVDLRCRGNALENCRPYLKPKRVRGKRLGGGPRDQRHMGVQQLLSGDESFEGPTACSIFIKKGSINAREMVMKVIEALKNNKSITRLDIRKAMIGVEGAERLADLLAVNGTLMNLFMFQNGLGDIGIRHLSHGLTQNTRLSKLNLCNNNIGPEGAKDIADVVAVCGNLTALDLNNNQMGDAGTTSIAHSLTSGNAKGRVSLRHLSMRNNNIGNPGASIMIDAVLMKPLTLKKLLRLNLDDNSAVDAALTKRLAAVVQATATRLVHSQFDEPSLGLEMLSTAGEAAT